MRFIAFSLGVLILAGGIGFFQSEARYRNTSSDTPDFNYSHFIVFSITPAEHFPPERKVSRGADASRWHVLSQQSGALLSRKKRRSQVRCAKRCMRSDSYKTNINRQRRQINPLSRPTADCHRNSTTRDPYWTALSDWYRDQRDWICEHCKIDLKKQKRFLHTHHTRGRAYNSPEHLKALCVRCHADERYPVDHSFMKDSREYKEFVDFYFRRLHNKA